MMHFYLVFLPFILLKFCVVSKPKKIRNLKALKSILPVNYEEFWLKSVVEQIAHDLQPTGATIWTNDIENLDRRLTYFVVQEFLKRLPTLQIDVQGRTKPNTLTVYGHLKLKIQGQR